jgi:hypothetical protein
MPRLHELAKLIRSKNAGPFELTFDVMFADEKTYRRVLDAGILTPAKFAAIYGIKQSEVRVMSYDAAFSIKITVPRPYVSGDIEDGDVYGGQQYGPLVDLEV